MSVMWGIYHLMRADFLERVRRYSFLVTVGLTVFLGYIFVPPLDASYQTVTLGNARGVYNSPWVGTMVGMLVSTVSPLITFYLIKNAIGRDRQTRVGQIIASTPTSKATYVLGKWLSNVALLLVLLGILTVTALAMQILRAEDRQVDLWALVAPIWYMGAPVLSIVAAVAVFFEAVPFLSGGLGNIIYYAVFMAALIVSLTQAAPDGGMFLPGNDLFGLSHPVADMQQELRERDPGYNGELNIGAAPFGEEPVIFSWQGIAWTPRMALERATWVCLSLPIALVAMLPFDRFDPARRRHKSGRRARSVERKATTTGRTLGLTAQAEVAQSPNDGSSGALAGSLTPLPGSRSRWRPSPVWTAELRLMLKGQPWWWYVTLTGLIVAGSVTTVRVALSILAVAWVWPLLIWSQMGTREARHRAEAIVFSAPYPLLRQLSATWLCGVLVALLAASGVAFRLLIAGEMAHLFALLVGAAFVPTLALALGAWSHTPRWFEVVYLVWWYGALNGAISLDFMGTAPEALARGMPLVYLGLTLALLAAAVAGRWIRLRK